MRKTLSPGRQRCYTHSIKNTFSSPAESWETYSSELLVTVYISVTTADLLFVIISVSRKYVCLETSCATFLVKALQFVGMRKEIERDGQTENMFFCFACVCISFCINCISVLFKTYMFLYLSFLSGYINEVSMKDDAYIKPFLELKNKMLISTLFKLCS